jgi:hypothetical protein
MILTCNSAVASLMLSQFFYNRIIGNKMCQPWIKQLENEGIQLLNWGFPFFSSVSTFIMCDNSYLTSNKIVFVFEIKKISVHNNSI